MFHPMNVSFVGARPAAAGPVSARPETLDPSESTNTEAKTMRTVILTSFSGGDPSRTGRSYGTYDPVGPPNRCQETVKSGKDLSRSLVVPGPAAPPALRRPSSGGRMGVMVGQDTGALRGSLDRPRNRGNSTPRRRLRSAPIDRVMRAARTIITLDKRVRVVIGGS